MSNFPRVPVSATPRNAIRAALALAFVPSTEPVSYGVIGGLPYAEIAACRFSGDDIEMTSDDQAEFWTLYTRDPHPVANEVQYLARAISDFESAEQALSFALNTIGPRAEIVFRRDFVSDPVDLTGEDATMTVDWGTGTTLKFRGNTEHGLATFGSADCGEYREFMTKNGLTDKPGAIDWIMMTGTHIDGSVELAETDARDSFISELEAETTISP